MANVDYNKAYELYTEKRCEMDAKAIEEEQKKLKRLRIGCYVLTAASVVMAIYCGKKLKDVMGVVGSAVTDVSNLTYIDVQQAVVDKAVEKGIAGKGGEGHRRCAGRQRVCPGRSRPFHRRVRHH